ncbi:MobF family relaxase [Nonomuraea dietziae]|uniref:MobF family relaxase n=1 Tax=Nonomuraea dietziae TaxID=65515 RepID=UPI0034428C3F
MAWVSVIGPSMEQVEYRLQEGAGCGLAQPGEHDHEPVADQQIAYRLADERGLMWIGEGLREVGITPQTPLTADQHEAAKALMSGVDPRTGEVLVEAKHLADPRAKLAGEPLVAALEAAAAKLGVTVERMLAARPAMVKRAAQLARGVDREGQAHLIRIHDVEKLARAAGLDLAKVYEAGELAYARKWRDATVRVGNRGYDLTLDVTKSVSVLYGLADAEFAAAIEGVFADAVVETVTAVEGWVAYGQRGHQGDGQLATRMDSTGLLGWVMWHRTARPVNGQPPDPHLHAHVAIANMARGLDGKWSAVGAGGRDIHRHAQAAGALLKARIRRTLTQRYGIAWKREEATGAWEIAAIPERTRVLFSKRNKQLKEVLEELGIDPASSKARHVAAAESRQARGKEAADGDLRAIWHRQADASASRGQDDDNDDAEGTVVGYGQALAEACRHGREVLPRRPSAEEIAAWIWRPEYGLTAHTKVVSRADVLAAVIDACPDGVEDLADAEALTDQVLACGPVVRLADAGAWHLANSQRYSSTDILQAEQNILQTVRARYGQGVAVVDQEAAALAVDAFEVGNALTFSAGQREVLERLMSAGHGVDAVIGVAGAGKTTIMAAARSGFEARGLVVRGAATAAVAAANLAAESGIRSSTIATWLLRIKDGRGLAGIDVLVVDEAAMVDDRQLATLLSEAERTGTKVVLIGDPLQLRAVGVGGAFRAIHRQVDGLTLTENRRQRDPMERKALELWRADQRREALRVWGEHGQVHAGRGADDTMARLIADWAAARQPYQNGGREAVHDELAGVLVLAGTNEAADRLNLAARAVRRELGEIVGPDRRYAIAGGRHLVLAVGDHVRVRKNDYRARRGEGPADVLNGYRGRVKAIDERGRVQVEWRAPSPEGPALQQAWLTPGEIAKGALSYGTAMTVAAAQGLTADHALIYGAGLDPHTLYAAMTRDRQTARLYLPRELLESDADRARHGQIRSEADALQRALAAYAATLEGDRADRLLTPEPDPIAHQDPAARPPAAVDAERPQDDHEAVRAMLDKAQADIRLASARLALSRSPYGVGLLSDQALAERLTSLTAQVEAAGAELAAAEHDRQRFARDGGGPAELALQAERDKLAAELRRIETAERAERRLQQARQQILEGRAEAERLRRRERELAAELEKLGSWRPSHRARRRDLVEVELPEVRERLQQLRERLAPIRAQGPAMEEAARESIAQAPRRVVWPMIRRRHDDLVGDYAAAQRGARSADVSGADSRAAAARLTREHARQELAAALDESERRADLPPDQRDIEHRVRSEEGARLRAEREKAERERRSREAEREQSRHRQLNLGHERPPPTIGRGGPSRGGGFGR